MSKFENIKKLYLIFFLYSHLALGQSGTEWEKQASNALANFNQYEESENKDFEITKERILKKWNEALRPEKKVYVEYFEEDNTRAIVDYENGSVVVETLQVSNEQSERAARDSIKKTLGLLVDTKYSTNSIILKDEITTQNISVPVIVNKIANEAEKLEISKGSDQVKRDHYRVTFKLVNNFIKVRAEKLRPIIEIWARKYNLDTAFILAIIRQESSFNPRARSRVGAIGLMQIMPQFAGSEVMKAISGKSSRPSLETLYDPRQNIMFGTTYLQIIRDEYFPEISEPTKRNYVMTASYNWGPHRIKTAINKGKLLLSATNEEIFSRLQIISPLETQEYLRKVKAYTEEFRGNR